MAVPTTSRCLNLAEWLIRCGASQSALALLGAGRGAAANRLRKLACNRSLRPGVYALGTTRDTALVVPLSLAVGHASQRSATFAKTMSDALTAVKALLDAPDLPALQFDMERWLAGFGSSLGLPAALAIIDHSVLPEQRLSRPVLATGSLEPDGSLLPVERLEAKLRMAKCEARHFAQSTPGAAPHADSDALLLCPQQETSMALVHPVRDLQSAVRLAFGDRPLAVDPVHLSVQALLQRSAVEVDHARAIQHLESGLLRLQTPADRARVLFALGTRHRHTGQTEQAVGYHGQAREILRDEADVLGAQAVEGFGLQDIATQLDEFRIQQVIVELEQRLRRPFLVLRNEMRARGMLAQALATSGRNAEAVRLREGNLSLQQREDWMQRSLAGTYCYLALDSARAADKAKYFKYAHALCQQTPRGDARQWRYNVSVLLRGLVLLGEFPRALEWAAGRPVEPFGNPPAAAVAFCNETLAISDHPEVSTARALCRALRKTGRDNEALALAQRIQLRPGLVGWLGMLAMVEASLSRPSAPGSDGASAALRSRWASLHAPASRYYYRLFDAPAGSMEREIDHVWY